MKTKRVEELKRLESQLRYLEEKYIEEKRENKVYQAFIINNNLFKKEKENLK